MACDTIKIETLDADEVVSIVTQGPQGPSGAEAATLTTTGDLLYRAALANDRLPIGSEGQVLKVSGGLPAWGNESGAVTSVNGETGAVVLDAADVGAAPSTGIDPTAITGTAVVDSDARLSDSRNPLSHSSSHASAGSDPLAPSDIGAQSIFVTEDLGTVTANVTLTAARAKIYTLNTTTSGLRILLPASDVLAGDIVQIRFTSSTGQSITPVRGTMTGFFTSDIGPVGGPVTFIAASASGTSWAVAPVDRHVHGNIGDQGNIGTTSGLPIKTGSGGILQAGAFGTGAGEFAEGNHTHADLHTRSHAITSTSDHTAGNHKVFYSDGSGQIQELALGNSGEVLTSNGATSAPSFAAASGGVSAVNSTLADILSVSGSDLVADDLGADKLYGFDDSEGKAIGFTIGSGLSVSGDTISATATGTIGGSTGSTDNLILRSDGTGGSTVQDSALVIDDATTSTQANVALVNNHSATNSALVLTPKGTGSFILGAKPDGSSTAGNARGSRAVDLQLLRNANTQVASGANSVIAGGAYNRASGSEAAICGGQENVASAQFATAVGGYRCTASGYTSFVGGGFSSSASGEGAVCVGGGNVNTVTGNSASGTVSAILGGLNGLADRYGVQAHAAGRFAANGDAQRVRAVLRNKTTTNSAVELFCGNASDLTQRFSIPSGKVVAMLINITGTKSDGSAVAHYVRQYCLKNVGGTTSEVYAAVTIGTDNAASTSITLSANDTNDAVKIEATGIASETWRWVASVDAVEVAYGS